MGRFKDLTGMRFSRLIVIRENGKDKYGKTQWLCKCDCGNTTNATTGALNNGNKRSCGCLHKETSRNNTFKDLTEQRFGKLVAIKMHGSDKGQALWLCRCDCGNEIVVRGADLRSGNTKSCGCLRKEVTKDKAIERWQDEEYRKMMSNKAEKQWKEGDLRQAINNLWEDEEYRAKMSKLRVEENKKMWEDDNFKEEHIKRTKDMWEDEEYRENHIKRMKEMWEDEEFKKNHSGENSYRYNPSLTEEDRQDRRIQQGYNIWKFEVKKQGIFTCDCCGDNRGGNLVSHHLESYDSNKELRIDITNGVCLCDKCHKEFHHIYGYGNNTKQQYIEFKENKKGDDK